LRFEIALTLGGDFEHGLAEIKAGGYCALLRKRECEVAGAAAQIKRAFAWLDLRELDDTAFPEPVQPEALQIVDQIVTPGDGGEEVVDLGGALFAGVVEGVAHADSLAQRRVAKSKPQKYGFAKVYRLW
jgi:hypothetical protein